MWMYWSQPIIDVVTHKCQQIAVATFGKCHNESTLFKEILTTLQKRALPAQCPEENLKLSSRRRFCSMRSKLQERKLQNALSLTCEESNTGKNKKISCSRLTRREHDQIVSVIKILYAAMLLLFGQYPIVLCVWIFRATESDHLITI